MISYIKKLLLFISILFLIVLLGLLLPTTPHASTSHLFAKLKTDSLLSNVGPVRLILVGGSNLSHSINSQILKDSLGLNPINTGLSWTIGFVYNFDNTLKYVRPGDVIVASLEYNQYYDDNPYGGRDLTRLILDVAPNEIPELRPKQVLNMLPEIPYYALTKYKLTEYTFKRDPLEVYDRNGINEYGDNCKHWNLGSRKINAEKPLPKKLVKLPFDLLAGYQKAIESKGARLLVTFPALHIATYKRQKLGIKAIESELKKNGFLVLGYPERYIMPDSVIFDTPYHLIKKGVDYRTQLLVEDMKKAHDQLASRSIP